MASTDWGPIRLYKGAVAARCGYTNVAYTVGALFTVPPPPASYRKRRRHSDRLPVTSGANGYRGNLSSSANLLSRIAAAAAVEASVVGNRMKLEAARSSKLFYWSVKKLFEI